MLSSLFLAYTLSDFYGASSTKQVPQQSVFWSETTRGGELTVLAESPTNDAGTVARGQTRVPLLSVELSASCDEHVQIGSIDLRHTGLGSVSDLSSIYALSGMRRVSRSAVFDQDGGLTLRLQRVYLEPCEIVNITIVADMSLSAVAGGEHGIALAGGHSVQSSAKRTEYATAQSTSSTVKSSPFEPGSVTVRFLPQRVNMLYGTVQTLARIQLTADEEGAHVLRELTLLNEGTARGHDFIDMRLEDRKGNILSRIEQHMDGRTAHFVFDPTYILERGDTIVLVVRGEVRTSYAKTLQFTLEEESDLVTSPYRRRLP